MSLKRIWFHESTNNGPKCDPEDLLIHDLWRKIITHLNELHDILNLGMTCKTFKIITAKFLTELNSIHFISNSFLSSEKNSPKEMTLSSDEKIFKKLLSHLEIFKQVQKLEIQSNQITSFQPLPEELRTLELVNCPHMESSLFPFLPSKLENLILKNCPFISKADICELKDLHPQLTVSIVNDKAFIPDIFDSYLITLEVKIARAYWVLNTGKNFHSIDLFCNRTHLDQLNHYVAEYNNQLSLPQYEKAEYIKDDLKSLLQNLECYKRSGNSFHNDYMKRHLQIQKDMEDTIKHSLADIVRENYEEFTNLLIHSLCY